MSPIRCAQFQFASLCFIRQVKSAILVFVLLLFSVAKVGAGETIWIDTDISIGSPLREVDDAFALLLAFHSPNLKIAGISTSYGNAPLASTTSSARELISKLEPRRPIYPGARSRSKLGRESEASTALAATLGEQRSLTYVALGPLTNLATFQLLHPALARRINRVIFIGGTSSETDLHFGTRHPIRVHDANVVKDPEAVRQVLRSKVPITLVPVETAARLLITAQDLDAIGRGGQAGRYVQQKSKVWLWFWTKFVGTEGGPIFDAAAILAVSDPGQVVIETRSVSVDTAGNLIISQRSGPRERTVSCVVKLSPRANGLVAEKLRAP